MSKLIYYIKRYMLEESDDSKPRNVFFQTIMGVFIHTFINQMPAGGTWG